MTQVSEYRKAYERAKQELIDLLGKQKEIELRIVVVRKSIQTLATLCESDGIPVEPSDEAMSLLENTTLADEIRAVLKSVWPGYLRPNVVKAELEKLGRELSQYQNPQATIQMVLKRMADSGEVQEGTIPEDGKKTYRICPPTGWDQARYETATAKADAVRRSKVAAGRLAPGNPSHTTRKD